MDAIGNVIIVIHLMVVVALILVVLLQRSEGGALGIGGGNAFLTSRGQGNVLTRATGILAAVFFITSIAMPVITRLTPSASHILDTVPVTTTTAPAGATLPANSGSGGIKGQLDRYLNPPAAGGTAPSAAGTTTTVPADTTTPPATGTAAPQVPTTQ